MLEKCIDSYHKNRAYQDKPNVADPVWVSKEEAINNFKFISVGSKHFLPAIIVDIDEGGKKEILKRIEKFPITPTYIVETNKGYHVWWVLKYPVKPGTKPHKLYKHILNTFIELLKGDNNAKMLNSGRVFRNPYKAVNYIYTPIEYTLAELYDTVKDMNPTYIVDPDDEEAKEKSKYTGKYIKLSSVKVGKRNISLTHNIGVYLRKIYTPENPFNFDAVLYWAEKQNQQFSEPLTDVEVYQTVKSMINNFDTEAKASEDRIKFNQKLARIQKLKNMKKAAQNLVKKFASTIYIYALNPENLMKFSDRDFQKIAGIGKNTANRYKKDLDTLTELYTLCLVELAELVKTMKSSKKILENCCCSSEELLKVSQTVTFNASYYTTSPP